MAAKCLARARDDAPTSVETPSRISPGGVRSTREVASNRGRVTRNGRLTIQGTVAKRLESRPSRFPAARFYGNLTATEPHDVLQAANIATLSSGADENRTRDLLHAMQALSQLSYSPDLMGKRKV
jgi:hypothetical protein